MLNGELSDRNRGYFAQPVFPYDQFESLRGLFFFDKRSNADTEQKGKKRFTNLPICYSSSVWPVEADWISSVPARHP